MASKTSEFYKNNPESAEKHREYERKRNREPGRKEYRKKHAQARVALGLKPGDKRDASATKSGGFTVECRSKNRARQGANGKSTKK